MSVSQLLKYRYTSVFFSVYCVNCLWQLSLCGYTPLFYPYCKDKSVIKAYEGDLARARCPKCGESFNPAAKDLEILQALYK